MSNVYMIGVNHADPEGDRKLDKTFKRIKPDLILVEGTQNADITHQHFLKALLRGIADSGLPREMQKALLLGHNNGYEWKRARTYARQYRAHMDYLNDDTKHASVSKPIDIQEIQELAAGEVDYLLDPEHLLQLPQLEALYHHTSSVDEQFHRVLVKTPMEHALSPHIPSPDARDIVMANTLREHISQNARARIATVTGYFHIISRPTNDSFYDRVADLKPERIFQFTI